MLADLLGNYWTKVSVDPLSSVELSMVLKERYPDLVKLVPIIIQTFELFQCGSEATDGQELQARLARIGRFISTRWATILFLVVNEKNLLFAQ